jgi:SecY interacting protein Syd
MNNTFLALDALLTRYTNLFAESAEAMPYVEFEAPWPSECVIKAGNIENSYFWKPQRRDDTHLFSDLEDALEFKFHQDIITFYGSFWSNGLCVERDDINFSLIQNWNVEDEKHLKENMLGHIFAKLKSKLPVTYFIGCTFGDEVISLDHESGNVVLEKPGFKAHKVFSKDLASFLISLQPTTDKYNP